LQAVAAPPTTHANTTTLTALSWNVRGLTRVAPEMDAIIKEYSPDFMVMSETKLTDMLHGKNYVKECAPGYHLRYSSVAHPSTGELPKTQ
jgi:exonuclease III